MFERFVEQMEKLQLNGSALDEANRPNLYIDI
jgi:hypothetical protein